MRSFKDDNLSISPSSEQKRFDNTKLLSLRLKQHYSFFRDLFPLFKSMTPASLFINFNDEEFKDVRLSRSLPKLSVFFFTHLCKLGLQTNRNGIEICNTVINTKFVMQIFVKFDYCTSLTVKLTQGQMSNQLGT